ncbi:hypothetical protein QTP88_007485 [Uroleucon formosanum]
MYHFHLCTLLLLTQFLIAYQKCIRPFYTNQQEILNYTKLLSLLVYYKIKDMNGINKENIEMSLFDNFTTLEFLYLKEFYYCALYAQHVNFCLPNTDGLSSSLNLLPNSTFRWFLWVVTVLTLIFNALVLYGRMFSTFGDENKAINFVIRNLAVADLFMVIYLTVIGYHDQIYRNKYYFYAHEWESSILCTIIGIMAVISSEDISRPVSFCVSRCVCDENQIMILRDPLFGVRVSMLILVFLSLERFLLIAVPFSGYQVLKLKTAVYCMVSIWVVGISISIAPFVGMSKSSHPISLYNRKYIKKNRKEALEERNENITTQENSLETTNGE